jgi:hypothetical protein
LTAGCPVLLDLGLVLMASLEAAIPAVPGWRIELPDSGSAIIYAPDGSAFYDGELDQIPIWRETVAVAGHAGLLSGMIGLTAAAPAGPAAQLQALVDAARAGLLVGGTVPVTGLPRPGRPTARPR